MKNRTIQSTLLTILLCFLFSTTEVKAASLAQGPLGGPQVAVIQLFSGFVQVGRAASPNNKSRVTAANYALASGDMVQTLQGRAQIRFNDNSIITLNEGTIVVVTERPEAGGVTRTISHFLGSLWFNIAKVAGSNTNLQTPTAVAAIRGTEGTQEVPNPDQSTHSLNEGLELITENVTRRSVTIRAGQRVTAIRGIGFTPVVALLGLLAQPVMAGGGGAAGGGGGGVVGGGAGGGVAGSASGAATGGTTGVTAVATTSVSSLSASIVSVAVVTGSAAAAAAAGPIAQKNAPPETSGSGPLSPPGGAVKIADGGDAFLSSVTSPSGPAIQPAGFSALPRSEALRPSRNIVSQLGGPLPVTSASLSMWAIGALTRNEKAARTGKQATQSVLTADFIAGTMKAIALRRNRGNVASGNAIRTFAFASVLSREYRGKPLVVLGAYGLATAASMARVNGQKQSTSEVIVGAMIGEFIGRYLTGTHGDRDRERE